MSTYGFLRWRTDTSASSDSCSYWSRHNTRTVTASGTTCTLQGQTWTTTAAASGNPTYLWNRQNVLMARGPIRRAGSRFGGAGWGCDLENPNHRCRPGTPESIRIAHQMDRKRKLAQKKAVDTSLRLLKSWLSEMEYQYLMEQGQLEVPSQYEKDVIYIVKKDPHKKIKLAYKSKVSCIHKPLVIETGEACIGINTDYPVGDYLLSNIALLKSDEKEFLNIANITQYTPPQRYAGHAGRFDYIRRERHSGFWFVQLDPEGRCGESYETTTDLNFLHIQHETIPVGDNVHNNIVVPGARQYFIWAREMVQAVQTARNMFAERQRDIEGYAQQAEQYVEQEVQQVVRMYQENPHNQEERFYITRLGYEEEGAHNDPR